ncbi:MAG: SpoIIE family protein phosphatase, partial [Planctomycetes bacterium]|nr:SpoIIE family protein phosphatase [Planctomycetota bacterium]
MKSRGEGGGPRRPGDSFSGFLSGDPVRDRRNVEILLETVAEVNSTLNLDELVVSVVDKSLRVTRAERGILLLYDGPEDRRELKVMVARDLDGHDLPPNRTVFSRSIPNKVAAEGRALCLIDAATLSDASLGQSIVDLRLLTVMCVPLRYNDRTIGVLYVDSRASAREFSEADLALFKALSYQLAVAIENARLVKEALNAERMHQSLMLARDIQTSLLPRAQLKLHGYDIYGVSVPCDETGGDYFDYIRPGEGRLGLVVGDVTGHGIAAALYMATARALMRAFITSEPDLGKIFSALNNALERDMGTGKFMTLFYGDVQLAERKLRYVRAGHNAPLLYHAAEDFFEELEAPGGMALGFVRDSRFEVAGPLTLKTGDILVLYTDGIPEARNARGELFGLKRMRDIVRTRRTRPSKEIVDVMMREVGEFSTKVGAEDDLTLIVLRVTEEGAVDPRPVL